MRWWMVALVMACLVLAAGCSSSPKLDGTNLNGRVAPDFHLRDSSGQAYALDQFRGKAVVLTFLYTNCTDTCPLTAELLRHADEAAGHPKDVVYLAVSVDPIGDTPANVAAFNAKHQMQELGDRWHYLVGSRQELENVWHNYFLFVPAELGGSAPDHTAVMYFIDRGGHMRTLSGIDMTAEALARNELLLAKV